MSITTIDNGKLRAVMAGRGCTAERLAELMGISTVQAANLTRSGRMRDATLWAVADALDVDVLALLPFKPGQLTTGQSMHLARLEKRMSLDELSRCCGLGMQALRRYENDSLPNLSYAWSGMPHRRYEKACAAAAPLL